ncbi:MAG: hypothetical protein K9M07_01785 [Simkaniaceae bacterium]|nr:hypothetical protein [Simkaniaceae bacterium]MCF7851953.1 hypothetical protein [Simkaniaceae bacterium]
MASGEVNFEQHMMEALDGFLGALNNATLVDGEASSPLAQLQNTAMTKGQKILEDIYSKDIAPYTGGGADNQNKLSAGQVKYNQANSTIQNVTQQAGNLVSKATNDVNNDSSQSQEALNMASTIINGVAFFNNLLSQSFAA